MGKGLGIDDDEIVISCCLCNLIVLSINKNCILCIVKVIIRKTFWKITTADTYYYFFLFIKQPHFKKQKFP